MPLRRKQQLIFDGIEHSIRFVLLCYDRLIDTLRLAAVDGMPQIEILDAAVMDAWGIIDHAKRLRTLVENAPGIKQTPDLKAFLAATVEARDFRHYIQHVESKTFDIAVSGFSLWGILNWINMYEKGKYRSHVYSPGRPATSEMPLINPLGRTYHSDIDHIQLTTYLGTTEISDLVRRARRLGELLVPAIKLAEESEQRDPNGLVRVEIRNLEVQESCDPSH